MRSSSAAYSSSGFSGIAAHGLNVVGHPDAPSLFASMPSSMRRNACRSTAVGPYAGRACGGEHGVDKLTPRPHYGRGRGPPRNDGGEGGVSRTAARSAAPRRAHPAFGTLSRNAGEGKSTVSIRARRAQFWRGERRHPASTWHLRAARGLDLISARLAAATLLRASRSAASFDRRSARRRAVFSSLANRAWSPRRSRCDGVFIFAPPS